MIEKDFVFISDFDGTISEKDFYWHIIDKYMKEEGNALYEEWKAGKLLDIEFLGTVFQKIGQDKEQIYKDILELPFDTTFKNFVQYINDSSGDFVVLSAGTSYYINILFEYYGIDQLTLYSNTAIFKDNGLHFDIDPTYEFYSKRYGIDKKKVVEHLRTKYSTLYYAGDSEPDYEASLLCDVRFAKGKLVDIYRKNNVNYYPFNNFKEVQEILNNKYMRK